MSSSRFSAKYRLMEAITCFFASFESLIAKVFSAWVDCLPTGPGASTAGGYLPVVFGRLICGRHP